LKISCLILNWRNASSTVACAKSVLAAPGGKDLALYVIDNASDDGSVDVLRRELPTCHLIVSPINGGYTGGNNLGLQAAFADGADAVLVLNNDLTVYLPVGFAQDCARLLSGHAMDLLALRVADRDTGRIEYPARPGRLVERIARQAVNRSPFGEGMFCGCSFVISAALYRAAGGFDERLFMYCDELDLSLRSARLGGQVRFFDEPTHVLRDCGPSDRRPYVFYYQVRNLLTIMRESRVRGRGLYLFACLLAFRNAWHTRRMASILATLGGVRAALAGQTGRSNWAHSLR